MENLREYLIHAVNVTSLCEHISKSQPVSKAGGRGVDLAEKIEQLDAQQGHRTASAYPTRPRQHTEGTFLP